MKTAHRWRPLAPLWRQRAAALAAVPVTAALLLLLLLLRSQLLQLPAGGQGGLRMQLGEQEAHTEQGIEQLRSRLADLEQRLQDKAHEVESKERERFRAQRTAEGLLKTGLANVYADSLVFRHYLATQAKQLSAEWQARSAAAVQQRGIVMAAGRAKSLLNAFVSLHVLRHHLKCTLPVAITYWGQNEADRINSKTKAFFQEHLPGITFVDASALPYPQYHRPLSPLRADGLFVGYKIKVFSIYAAPFTEVLFLDSDCSPLLDPSVLFQDPQYRQHGNLFWPDFFEATAWQYDVGKLYKALRVEPNPWGSHDSQQRQAETGQFLIDRSRHWQALEWLLFLTTRDDVIYRSIHGDKDTFRLAFHMAANASSFQQVARKPAMILTNRAEGGQAPKGILQLHPNGTALFNHRTPKKHSLRQPLPPTTYISASASSDLSAPLIYWGQLEGAKMQVVYHASCKYSLWDWPAAAQACAPSYDEARRGEGQRLPVFEVPPDSHFSAGEVAADEGYKLALRAFT